MPFGTFNLGNVFGQAEQIKAARQQNQLAAINVEQAKRRERNLRMIREARTQFQNGGEIVRQLRAAGQNDAADQFINTQIQSKLQSVALLKEFAPLVTDESTYEQLRSDLLEGGYIEEEDLPVEYDRSFFKREEKKQMRDLDKFALDLAKHGLRREEFELRRRQAEQKLGLVEQEQAATREMAQIFGGAPTGTAPAAPPPGAPRVERPPGVLPEHLSLGMHQAMQPAPPMGLDQAIDPATGRFRPGVTDAQLQAMAPQLPIAPVPPQVDPRGPQPGPQPAAQPAAGLPPEVQAMLNSTNPAVQRQGVEAAQRIVAEQRAGLVPYAKPKGRRQQIIQSQWDADVEAGVIEPTRANMLAYRAAQEPTPTEQKNINASNRVAPVLDSVLGLLGDANPADLTTLLPRILQSDEANNLRTALRALSQEEVLRLAGTTYTDAALQYINELVTADWQESPDKVYSNLLRLAGAHAEQLQLFAGDVPVFEHEKRAAAALQRLTPVLDRLRGAAAARGISGGRAPETSYVGEDAAPIRDVMNDLEQYY